MTVTGLFQIAAVATGFGPVGSSVQSTGGTPTPTKSAVVGMLAAADGRHKGDSIDDLNALQIGSVELNAGIYHSRFSTVVGCRQLTGEMRTVDNKGGVVPFQRDSPLIRRRTFYQASHKSPMGDWLVRHLIGFQSEDEAFVRHLLRKLVKPEFPIFIGRKNCAPAETMAIGLVQGDLFDAFDLVKVKSKAVIEVAPSMPIRHKIRQLDVLDNFGSRRVQSRMVVKQTVG